MNDISIGAVGAAIIAGLVSLLGLIIGKEQKVSEFRQAWIDELRKCLVSYLVNINAISDFIRSSKGKPQVSDDQLKNYKALNEANHGIRLRVNADEDPAKNLLSSMENFEKIAQSNNNLTPQNIKDLEDSFLNASKDLLKFEWKRVKKGEPIYVWTKRIIISLIAVMFIIFSLLWFFRKEDRVDDKKATPQSSTATLSCSFYNSDGRKTQIVKSMKSNNSDLKSSNIVKHKVNPHVCLQNRELKVDDIRDSLIVNSSN